MHRLGAFFLLVSCACAVTVKSRPCSGGVEAARLQVDVVRPSGGDPRSLSRIKQMERGSKVIYKPIGLAQEQKNNAKVGLIVGPAEGEKDVPSSLTILEFKPAGTTAEWIVPFRVRLAVFIMGPQGLDEKRVSNLVTRDEELIGALADYAEQTRDIEDTVETLTALEDEENSEFEDTVFRLDRGSPTEQALSSILKALNPTLMANNPLGAGKRIGPQTLLNKASIGFFENAGGLFPGGGALSEIKPFLFPDTDFRAAFVQPVGTSLAFCVPRPQAKSRNRQVYVWALRVIDVPAPSLALTSTLKVPIGARSTLPVKPAKVADWRYPDRIDTWTLTPVAGGEPVPVKVRLGQGRTLDMDLRGFPGGPGKYRLGGEWDWDRVKIGGDLDLMPLGNMKQARLSPQNDLLVASRGVSRLQLEGPDFQFIEKVSLLPAGGQAELAQPLQFVLAQGRRAGVQKQMSVEVDTSTIHAGSYLLALQQPDSKPQELPVAVQPTEVRIDNLPLKVTTGSQRVVLRGVGLDRLRTLEIPGADVTLEAAGANAAERVAVVQVRNGRKGDKVEGFFQVEGSDQKRKLAGAIQMLGPKPRISGAKASPAADLTVAVKDGEVASGSFTSFSLQVEGDDVVGLVLACNGAETKLRMGAREAWGSVSATGKGSTFLSLDPGSRWGSGCDLTAAAETSESVVSDPATLGRVVRLPRIESIAFTGEKLSDGSYAAVLTGQDLEVIEKSGWSGNGGVAVGGLPVPVAGQQFKQTLRVGMPWPSPAPRSAVYVWIRGEAEGRATTVRY